MVLGSATPSLETWQRAEAAATTPRPCPSASAAAPGRRCAWSTWAGCRAQARAGAGAAPGLAPQVVAALQERVARGEQSLVFLNRRGYAPVLHCGDCGWKSGCPHCSAWRVFHKLDRTLRCHHCGFAEPVPRACPDCGNLDIAPIGRGTERLEEQLAALLPEARIARIDADSTRRKGALEAQLGAVHAGEVDVLVGTQMVAKGHDFRRITLVAAVNPDTALFSSDFRAPERLFALLMQAAGRAGRDAASGAAQRDVGPDLAPAACALRGARPPRLRRLRREPAEGAGERRPAAVLAPRRAARRGAHRGGGARLSRRRRRSGAAAGRGAGVMIYAPVPLGVARVANVERMQMLVESASRGACRHAARLAAAARRAARRARRRRSASCAGRSTSIRWRSEAARSPAQRERCDAGDVGEQQGRANQLLDRGAEVGRRLERLDLGEQVSASSRSSASRWR